MASLQHLLLGRLPAPVVRLDWRLLLAVLRRPEGEQLGDSVEAELVQRYRRRYSAPVAAALRRMWEAARAGESEEGEAGLSGAAFIHFHGLVTRALFARTDERTRLVIAECEWALSGGEADHVCFFGVIFQC